MESGGLGEEEQAELVTMIIAEGRRLVRSVDNVIVGSRLPMGRVELLARPVDLAAAAHEAASGRAVVSGSASGIGDPGRMTTIIGNLVDNAEMHGSGRITVAVWDDDRRAWFEVRDEGPGVDVPAREAIFGRYETRNDRETQPASMGLGLPVSRELLRAMGGDLDCVGAGNQFRGWLPLARIPVRHGV